MKKITTKELIEEANRRGQTINAIIELHYLDDTNPLLVDHCFHCKTEYPCDTVQIIIDRSPLE